MKGLPTHVEFYNGAGGPFIVSVESEAVPRAGEYVNISRKTWLVERVTWAVDQPGGVISPTLRANVDLIEP